MARRQRFNEGFLAKSGFKCDAPGCDYRETTPPDVKFEYVDDYEEYMRSYLTKNCPVCGAPLLTQADFESSMLLVKIFHNPLIRAIDNLGSLFGANKKLYHVGFDGSGTMTINEHRD
jgi:hypothetical protein